MPGAVSPPRVTAEETARSLCRQLGVSDAGLLHLRDGREHHLFELQTPEGLRLLKFAREDCLPDPYDRARKPEDRLRAEKRAISLAKNVEVPADYEIHETTPLCSTMAVLPGTTAEIALESGRLDEEGLQAVCLELGKTLAALHSRRRPADVQEAAAIPDLPGSDPLNARLLHLDFHLGNVLVRPALGGRYQVMGVVDWTCARWGPPEADLVEMYVSVFVLNPRAGDAFVAGYRRASGRAVDMKAVEASAAAEIKRRLVEDPPGDDVLAARWKDWVAKR